MIRVTVLCLLALSACDSQAENVRRCTAAGGHMVMLMAADKFFHPWLCARIEIIDIGSK